MLLVDSDGEFTVEGRRKQYGKDFPLWGGMDLRDLLSGERGIDEMIDRVFSDAEEGGYFPFLNDMYGSGYEVTFEMFEYFAKAFRKANGIKCEE